jgi:O-succinylbenzoic acid--CoA ligase
VTITRATIEPYALPLRAPLPAADGWLGHRHGWLLRIEDDSGKVGYGDGACWPGFGSCVDGHGSDGLATALGALVANRALVGVALDDVEAIARWLGRLQPTGRSLPPEAQAAIELALLDLLARRDDKPLAALLFHEVATRVESHRLVLDCSQPGSARHLKVKLGSGSANDDLRTLAEIRARAGAAVSLRVDVGGRWTVEQALARLDDLARFDVQWLEQPVAAHDLDGLRKVRTAAAGRGLRVAADEAVVDRAAAERIVDRGAADGLVLKPMFLGGLLPCLALARSARERGIDVMITNALESAIGRAGAVHLAAGLPGVHGMSSALGRDVAELGEPIDGWMPLPRGAGHGMVPDGAAPHSAAPHSAAALAPGRPARSHDRGAPHPAATLRHPLASAAENAGARPALASGTTTVTAAELVDRVARRAAVLHARGVEAGMVVALDGPHDLDWVVDFHAIGWLGAVVAPIAHDLPPDERRRALDELEPRAVLQRGEASSASEPTAVAAMPEREWSLDEPRVMVCSSGSTGRPRWVVLRTGQLLFSAFGSALRLGHLPGDRWLCCLPLHHVAGVSILMRCAIYGTTVQLQPFDAASVARALDDGDITQVSLVPSMLEGVLDQRPAEPFPSTLRAILLGGAATPPALLDRCAAIDAPVARTWGMTEAASQIATCEPGDMAADAGSGAALVFTRVTTQGERLALSGPIVGRTWVTNDRGYLEQGRVHVTGRADDLLVSGGENVAPAEVVAVLRQHPAVDDAWVFAVASERWGQRPVAAIESSAEPCGDEALRRFCRARLSHFKVPDHFVWFRALPRTALGKIAGARTRELALAELAGSAKGRAEPAATASGAGPASQKAELAQTFDERFGGTARRAGVEVEKGVNQAGGGAQSTIGAAESVGEHDRVVAQALDLESNLDAVVHTDRPLEVGVGMHQRHGDVQLVDQPVDVAIDGEQQLFEGLVTELEDAPEEDNSSAVYLEEPRGVVMHERHDDDAR